MGPHLRDWLHKHYKQGTIDPEASDDSFSDVLYEMLADGDATAEQLAPIIARDKGKTSGDTTAAEAAEDESIRRQAEATIKQYGLDDLSKILRPAEKGSREMSDTKRDTPQDVLFAATKAHATHDVGDNPHIRVGPQSEKYSANRAVGKHYKTGLPVISPATGRPAELGSDREHAQIGAWFKRKAMKAGFPGIVMSEHETGLLAEFAQDGVWYDMSDIGQDGANVSKIAGPSECKALLDDSSSGGQHLSPAAFDDRVITFPLLFGEILPMVDVVNVGRGSSIDTASIANPTVVSGPVSGSAASPFNTASMITQIQTSMFVASTHIEVSLDFGRDGVVDIGDILSKVTGEAFMEYYDNQLINGDGTTEIEGILNASGTTTFSYGSGTTGPPTIDDIEGLLKTLPKQYRRKRDRSVAFCSSDTTYFRHRGISVSGSDARRIFGMSHEDYLVFDRPWLVQNTIGNQSHIFGNFSKYRFYRRAGLDIRFETGGNYLTLRDLGLFTARSRQGGRVMDANAFVIVLNGQS